MDAASGPGESSLKAYGGLLANKVLGAARQLHSTTCPRYGQMVVAAFFDDSEALTDHGGLSNFSGTGIA
ncbi:MAG: hypothetical protein WAM39_17655 [Bryobacteraceae bacterium]